MANNRILYLTHDGLTDPLGQSQILPYLTGLSAKGFEITIVSFEKPIRYEPERETIQHLCDQSNMKWVPLVYHKTPTVIATLWDLRKLRLTAARLHRVNGFHVVHCRSYVTSLVGLWMKQKFGLKFLFDMRGFWADERVEGGLWNFKVPGYRLIYNYFKKKEREFLSNADHIISLTHNAKREILSWGIAHANISVIPTCVDFGTFNPDTINKENQGRLRKHLRIEPGTYVLLYLGSWGTWYKTNEMLDFFSALKAVRATAKFLIVSQDLPDIAGHQFAQDIIVVAAKRSEVPLYISLADAAVFFILPTFSKKASSATKMGELMAMNVPIVTNSGWGDVVQIAAGSGCVLVEEFTNSSYRRAIDALQQPGQPTRQNALDIFSLTNAVEIYNDIYDELLRI